MRKRTIEAPDVWLNEKSVLGDCEIVFQFFLAVEQF